MKRKLTWSFYCLFVVNHGIQHRCRILLLRILKLSSSCFSFNTSKRRFNRLKYLWNLTSLLDPVNNILFLLNQSDWLKNSWKFGIRYSWKHVMRNNLRMNILKLGGKCFTNSKQWSLILNQFMEEKNIEYTCWELIIYSSN